MSFEWLPFITNTRRRVSGLVHIFFQYNLCTAVVVVLRRLFTYLATMNICHPAPPYTTMYVNTFSIIKIINGHHLIPEAVRLIYRLFSAFVLYFIVRAHKRYKKKKD